MIYISPADDDDDDGCSAAVVQVYIPVQDTKGESGWWVGAGRSRGLWILSNLDWWLYLLPASSSSIQSTVFFSAIYPMSDKEGQVSPCQYGQNLRKS